MAALAPYPDGAQEWITTHEAFVAMQWFLMKYWDATGRPADELLKLLSQLEPNPDPHRPKGEPIRAQAWREWRTAVCNARHNSSSPFDD